MKINGPLLTRKVVNKSKISAALNQPGALALMEINQICVNYWKKLSPLTKNILIFFLGNAILINLILLLFLTPLKNIGLSRTLHFLTVHLAYDSWMPMIQALDYLEFDHQKPLYTSIFFENKIKFQYPPTSLLLLVFLRKTTFQNLLGDNLLLIITGIISWIFIVVTALFTVKVFNLSLKNINEDQFSKTDTTARNVIITCLVLSFYPVMKAYSLGQIQVWINSIFAILFWCWMKDKKGISGVLVGIICLIKPQYTIILLWGILRKQWIFVATCVSAISAGLFVSIVLFGTEDHINYLSVLSFISKRGEAFYPNQSVNGLLNRLLFNGDNLVWQLDSFPPFNPWVYIGTMISSIIFVAFAILNPKQLSQKGGTIDFSIIALTCTVASPVAWEHHYGILLPIYAFLLPHLMKLKVFGRITIPYLSISYILTSNYFDVTKRLAYAPFNLNIFQSYQLIGALMVLICLFFSRNTKIINNGSTKVDSFSVVNY